MAMSSSYLSSPDTPSTIFPERLIRPLPKRSIKSRLSLEAAESITYPPTLPSTSLPTYTHYGEDGEYTNDGKVLVHHHDEHDHDCDYDHDSDHHDHDCPHHHHHCCHHDDYEDDLDDLDSMVPVSHYLVSSPPRSGRHPRYSKGSLSGPDGYEAFENTNNKKKRKIPTSGSLSLHHSSMTSEFAHMAINNDGSTDDSHYHVKNAGASPGHGVQGAGRGRNARKLPGRNPLGVSVNGSNARSKYDQNLSANAKAEESRDQGIISAAIANATALLRKPLGKGQENMGVLDQQVKQAHTNSQFTFTCEADAKGVTFPEQSLYSPGYSQRNNLGPQSQATSGQKGAAPGTQGGHNVAGANTHQAPAAQPNAANANGKKPRRRKGDVYVLAARQRRLQQEYNNLQHPPAPEDIWICEFCEYESIFGEPPHALIRQYEIKDRKERRRLAEKRRLLEKAKLKGRKGHRKLKKSSTHQPTPPPEEPLPDFGDNHLDSLVDDGLDDEYENDPVSPAPAPAPPAPTRQSGVTGANATTDKAGGTGGGGGVR